jgi:hypothetical protein
MAEEMNEILTWMQNNPELLGWDMIAAVDTQQLNPGLTQSQLSRWQAGNNIADLEGAYDIGGLNMQHCLSNVRLDAPQLSLGWASAQRPVANVVINVEGTRTTIEKPQKVRALYRFDALDPAQLSYTQLLNGESGDLLLDLAEGEDYALDQRLPEIEQWEGGRFFQRELKLLSPEQRHYVLGGHLQAPQNDFLANRYVTATTRLSADGKRQALLMFVAMQHSRIGSTPSDGAGFPFLLPSGIGADKSGTLLMNLASLQRASYAHAVTGLFQDGALTYRYDQDKHLLGLAGKAGVLRIPPIDYSSESFSFESEAFELDVVGLNVDFSGADVRQTWNVTQTVRFTYRVKDEVDKHEAAVSIAFALDHLFWLLADDRADALTRGQLLARGAEKLPVRLVSGLGDFTAGERAQVEEFIGYAVTKGLYNSLAPKLSGRTGDHYLCTFGVAGGKYFDFARAQVESPNNLALFSDLQGEEQNLRIVQQSVRLKARQVHKFTLETPIPGVTWTVEALPGSSGAWGEVTAQGEYTAPGPNAMAGKPARVLVVATDPATGTRSVAHVTVLVGAVSVNPRIQVLQPKQTVLLTAGSASTDLLSWKVLQPGPGSGKLLPVEQGDNRVYEAGTAVSDSGFIIDRVEVTDSTGEQGLAYMLVEQVVPELAVLLAEAGQPDYGLQLEARYKNRPLTGVRWSLPLEGPGYLDENGLYEPDEYSHEAFVLIAAHYATEEFGDLVGYIILPLPLAENSQTLRLLTADHVAEAKSGR